MSRTLGERFELSGWRFVIPASTREPSSYLQNEVAENIVAALEGKRGAPFRRSRHATTWRVQVVGATGESTHLFVKQLDVARGLVALAKEKSRPKRSDHVLRISEDLRADGFGVPHVLLIGEERATGKQVIVMSQAAGLMLTRWMNPSHQTDVSLRRAILRKLGAEIARLHCGGYIHGDLTPYNIFATDDPQTAITFIDHEGTERTTRVSFNVARNRLRNMVQLGHFDIPGVSRTDKLRVFASYATSLGLSKGAARESLLRLIKMIVRRRKRDRAIKRATPQPAIIAGEGVARG
jgi:serine/threonine protein kinase